MSLTEKSRLPDVVNKYEQDILQDWMKQQLSVDTLRADLIKEAELREQSAKFLALFRRALQNGSLADMTTSHWDEVRELLADVSASRARQGFTPSETATFVFSLKQPLFTRLQKELGKDGDAFMAEVWAATVLLDKLGLHTMEMFQKSREEVIGRQQQGLLELSTPVVRLWEGVLALPLIGTLDSERTQIVMQNLLQRIVETGS
ncbi:MAG: anti-anti-sigma factor, partial [Nitrospiraceae bacterium]